MALLIPGYELPRTQARLPEDHTFRAGMISADERADILYESALIPDEDLIDYRERAHYMGTLGDHIIEVGVDKADPSGNAGPRLVGYGLVTILGYEANFCNLVVLPESRGRGIGKAIVDERIRRARHTPRVRRIVIDRVEDTNTIASYYPQLGFTEDALGFHTLELSLSGRVLQRLKTARDSRL